jgi:hypothetical protein
MMKTSQNIARLGGLMLYTLLIVKGLNPQVVMK